MKNLQSRPVMLLVSRRPKPGSEAQFEKLMAEFILLAETFPGCIGAQLVPPGDDPVIADRLYHVLLAFNDASCLDVWQTSAERAKGLASIAPYIEGAVAEERWISGLAHWFQLLTVAQPIQPPRWKVAVVTWLGIFPTVYLVFLLLGNVLAPWSLLVRIFVITLLVVAIMTWGVAPRLTRLFRPWLYAPKTP